MAITLYRAGEFVTRKPSPCGSALSRNIVWYSAELTLDKLDREIIAEHYEVDLWFRSNYKDKTCEVLAASAAAYLLNKYALDRVKVTVGTGKRSLTPLAYITCTLEK